MIASEARLTRRDCSAAIGGHRYEPPSAILRAAAARVADADERDTYGAGTALAAFEAQIAAQLGLEAAVFMPSGTMAQQIALRIVAERTGRRGFAAHPTNHVVLHERDGFARLHDLHFVPAGSSGALITLEDLRTLREPVGTLLLELPQRELRGELPAWHELVALAGEARARGWHLHLDGARLWECGPAFARPYAEIGALFDSVYVSFYKGIGALAGAMLAGPQTFVDEARLWQRRHGGNLVTLFPYGAIARQSYADRIDRMAAYRDAARRIARALGAYRELVVRPDPPPTNMLHVFVRGARIEIEDRVQRIARAHGVWTIERLGATAVPDVWRWEINCGDAAVALTDEQLRVALDGLFGSDG